MGYVVTSVGGQHHHNLALGISSRGRCLWVNDKDYKKQIPILAHAGNSVSGLALDFDHGLALDFGLDNSSPVTLVTPCG